jgi:hypothetical protein
MKPQKKRNTAILWALPSECAVTHIPKLYLLSLQRPIFLGRDPCCEIVIDPQYHRGISRIHAKISPMQRSNNQVDWELLDLNSTNGTYVNDCLLEGTHLLKTGDHISLSSAGPSFRFESPIPSSFNPLAMRWSLRLGNISIGLSIWISPDQPLSS